MRDGAKAEAQQQTCMSRPIGEGKERPLYCEDLDVLCPKGKPAEEHFLSGEFLSFRMCLMAESVRCFDVLKQVSDL